jgi:TonB-dependent SusC/RagA subfamily outer membrane receptor
MDIESIEIVKGAAAASLYGSRAANGVIQITTQRGQATWRTTRCATLVRTEYGHGPAARPVQPDADATISR